MTTGLVTQFGTYSILPPKYDGSLSTFNPKQSMLFVELMPDDLRTEIAHWHDLDIALNSGTAGSGKSIGTASRALYFCKNYPGSTVIFVSTSFKHLEKTCVKDFKRILHTNRGWQKHPWVKSLPNQQTKTLVIRNIDEECNELEDSQIIFLGVGSDPTVLLSMSSDMIVIEEAQRIFNPDAFETLVTRLRSVAAPLKQVVLNINPHIEDADWLWSVFKLHQLVEGYSGPIEPIGKPCDCHLCENCELVHSKKIEYIDGKCPTCNWPKRNQCPGKQYFSRVIQSSFLDNLSNLPPTYARDIAKTLSGANLEAYGKGAFTTPKAGKKCYYNYQLKNIETDNPLLDPTKEILFAADFNRRPQCSSLSQIHVISGQKHLFTKEEIYEYNADVDRVAHALIKLLKPLDPTNWISLYGDPAGRNKDPKHCKFQTIYAALKKSGFEKVRILAPFKAPRIDARVRAVNELMCRTDIEGNELIRWHVSDKCHWMKASAAATIWDKDGKHEDYRNDVNHRDRGPAGELTGLTHYMAGLGYMVHQLFPPTPGNAFKHVHANLATNRIITLDDDGQVKTRDLDTLKEVINSEPVQALLEQIGLKERDMDSIAETPKLIERYEEPSFADFFRQQGMWRAYPDRRNGTS